MKSMALGLGLHLMTLGMLSTPEGIALGNHPMGAVIAMLKIGAANTRFAYGVIAPGHWIRRLAHVTAGGSHRFGHYARPNALGSMV